MLLDKIDSFLRLRGKNINGFSKTYGISQPNLSQKAKKNSYYLKEGILSADYGNADLAFIDKETGEILTKFSISDIELSEK